MNEASTGPESRPAGDRVTEHQLRELAATLRYWKIPERDFLSIREASGLGRGIPPTQWSVGLFHEIYALALWTASCMETAQQGLHGYLRHIGAPAHQIAAAEAAYQALVAGKERAA